MPGKYKAAMEAFLNGGGAVPPGAKSLGRWHTPGSTLGWHLGEGDLTAIAQHVADWGCRGCDRSEKGDWQVVSAFCQSTFQQNTSA